MATIEDIKKLLEKKHWTDVNDCPSGGYYDFPHTRNYDSDLGFLIRKYKELGNDYNILVKIYEYVVEEIKDITLNQLQEWLNDGTLENIIMELGQVVKYIDVTKNISNENVVEGQVIFTKGYSSINDGGEASFIIEKDKHENLYQIKTNNNLYATFIGNVINPLQFGCKCDGIVDDTEKFQELINLAEKNNNYEIILTRKIGITNITIDEWCRIDFNNQRIILLGDSGIGVNINPLYNFNLTTQQNIDKGFGSQYFKNIYIDGNMKQGYDFILSISSRDTVFNSIKIVNALSNGLNVTGYDGMNILDLFIRGDVSNNGLDIVGLTVSREDNYFNKVEICYFQTLMKMAVNISTQFNMLHLWNNESYTTKNIGIDVSSVGVGCWYGSIIFDTLNIGFYGGSTFNTGFPMKIEHIRMFNSQGTSYLFKDVTQNLSLNVDISLVNIDSKLSNNTFLGSIWNTSNKINQNYIDLGFEKLINNITFIKNGNRLKSLYNVKGITVDSPTSSVNLGKLIPNIISDKIPPQVSYGTCIFFDSSNNLFTVGILSVDFSSNNFIIYTDKELQKGSYSLRLDLDIIISTW